MPSRRQVACVLLQLAVWQFIVSPAASGFEIELPPVGTVVNYLFQPDSIVLKIGERASLDQALEGRAMFASGRHLSSARVEGDSFMTVHLNLRAPNIVDRFADHLEVPGGLFDEQLSLLDANGEPLVTLNNTTVGTSAAGDVLSWSWDFHGPGQYSWFGFQWRITPNGPPISPTLKDIDLDAFVWGAPVRVVPEPSSAALAGWGVVALSRRLGRRQ